MTAAFLATLTPMLTLFLCIAVGFALRKGGILPDSSGKVMAKLETWVFMPALSFMTMARHCTVSTLSTHGTNILLSVVAVAIAIGVAIPLAKAFTRPGTSERGVYLYALTFANSGYMGDPIVQALFGDVGLSYYKVFCLPISLAIYTYGVSRMIPGRRGSILSRIVNPPTVSLLLGMAVGLSGLGARMPAFLSGTLEKLGACMGPVAMLLAGFTIAGYRLRGMLSRPKIYAVSLLRLTVLPSLIVVSLFLVRLLLEAAFHITVGNAVFFYAFFATGAALGLNTVVFPEAYGGDPETGAGMTLISHTLAVLSIPLFYSLLVLIFGTPVIG